MEGKKEKREGEGARDENVFGTKGGSLWHTNVASWLQETGKKKESVETPSSSFPMFPFAFRQQHKRKGKQQKGSNHLHTCFTNGPGILSSCDQLSLLSLSIAFTFSLLSLPSHANDKTIKARKKKVWTKRKVHTVEDNPSRLSFLPPDWVDQPENLRGRRKLRARGRVSIFFSIPSIHATDGDASNLSYGRVVNFFFIFLFLVVLDLPRRGIAKEEINPEGRPFFLSAHIFVLEK